MGLYLYIELSMSSKRHILVTQVRWVLMTYHRNDQLMRDDCVRGNSKSSLNEYMPHFVKSF